MSRDRLSGKEIFSELKPKALKKLSKKELDDVVAINLQPLLDYYFYDSFRGEERKYEDALTDLACSFKFFIKPLQRLIKKDKKSKGNEVPDGLHVMLKDSLEKAYRRVDKRIQSFQGGGKITPETEEEIKNLQAMWLELRDAIEEICEMLTKKTTKKLMKLGMAEEFAVELAATVVPEDYLNEHNVRKYIHKTNQALYNITRRGVKRDESEDAHEDEYINTVGVNLTSTDVIKEIYEIVLKGAERDVVINGIAGIMLEKRGGQFQNFTKPQLSVYNAITKLALSILEGEDILNTNGAKFAKGKAGKKAKKELAISKKELRKFMKFFSSERRRDIKNGHDAPRRVSFTNLADDMYPNVIKAFKRCAKDSAEELMQSTDAEKQRFETKEFNNSNQNNRNNDRGNDRNNDHNNQRNNHKNGNNNNRR